MSNPPEMAGWNLALRFVLEMTALGSLGAAGWNLSTGALRWVAMILLPVAAATLWGVFNVLNDPSRSGSAPIEVPGWIRLAVEFLVLGGGAVALGYTAGSIFGISFAALTAVHYAASWKRVQWLTDSRNP